MSIDENINENETPKPSEAAKQPESNAPEVGSDLGAAKVSSAGTAESSGGNLLVSFLALKDSNPKVFFGAIGTVVVLLIVLFTTGGSDSKLPVHQAKPVVIGQNYVLKGANAYDQQATIRLVAVPGSMAAYDDTEENDRDGGCKHIKNGTPVKVVQSQDAYGKKDVFVEVEMLEGECEGKKGWALAINLQ